MGAVSKIQIKYGCNFVTACKTEGVCRFVTKHKKELQEILHHKSRRELETLFQLDNILDWEERIKFCRYLGDHRKDFRTISRNPRQFNYRDESVRLCMSAP